MLDKTSVNLIDTHTIDDTWLRNDQRLISALLPSSSSLDQVTTESHIAFNDRPGRLPFAMHT